VPCSLFAHLGLPEDLRRKPGFTDFAAAGTNYRRDRYFSRFLAMGGAGDVARGREVVIRLRRRTPYAD
jgi:hypothetical protein